MKEKLLEARDICAAIIDGPRDDWPVAIIRVHGLLEQVLADWWDDDEVVSIPIDDELVGDLSKEDPFPAA
jgi:hypothetical protein